MRVREAAVDSGGRLSRSEAFALGETRDPGSGSAIARDDRSRTEYVERTSLDTRHAAGPGGPQGAFFCTFWKIAWSSADISLLPIERFAPPPKPATWSVEVWFV